ncbi:hypothetical protein SCLCIDRAFT_219698 [Scleroderma citrinum Foug A]|uniref:RING-type domain-containing protein n=1 Tax=Scleroderma citrinum Foug A TaxID=1036808 RepID=A0A0C3EFG8_9AGAM|nr:hypothetical protein SCLCIDRAFT_219698 [Scleroderma citrinum Foug A]
MLQNAYYLLTFFQGDLGDNDMVGISPITTPSKTASPKTKGKGKAKFESERTLQDILEGYENEITCPICCDVLAAAFMTNPCGHTTCGDCGYGWISRNIYSPTCSVCRSELIKIKPLLPNYAVDNLVKHHVHALSISGRPEWQERGFRFIEWNKRLDAWKKQYTKILAEENARELARKRRYQSRYFEDDPPWLPVEDFLPSPNNRPRRRTRRT